MFNRILIVIAVVTIANSHDITVGDKTDGRKIFDEARQASPAIWRQTQNLTVNATDAEVISRVVVKDQRPEKDGEAKVIDGGVGQKSVTLELKSPTALRGYDFQVEVYTSPDENASGAKSEPNPTRVQRNSQSSDDVNVQQTRTDSPRLPEAYTNVPVLTKDAKINNNAQSGNAFLPTFTERLPSTEINFNVPKDNIPVTPSAINTQNNGQVRYSRDSETKVEKNPTITSKDFDFKNTSEVQDELSTSNRKVRETESEDNTKKVNLPPFVPLHLGKDIENDTLPRTENVDSKSTTPSYNYQHRATNDDYRKTRDIKNDGTTQIPRLLTNKPVVSNVKDSESERTLSGPQTNNEPKNTTPKFQNARRVRESDENVEINPPAFQNNQETPSEESRFLPFNNNKGTTTSTTSTTTVKSRKREAETEFPVTLNPKSDDDEDDYRPKPIINGTRLLPPKPVISLQ